MSKIRLTITLSKQILNLVDKQIDKINIRNRSHAIETLLEKSLRSNIDTAVILAGEKDPDNKKIRPLTLLNNKPLILYTIEHLLKFHITNIVIVTNSKFKQIEKDIGNGDKFGAKITYIYEDHPRGTAGALKSAQSHLNSKPFFVLHGDILTNINLSDMAQFHTEQEALITVAVKPRTTKETYSNVFIQGNTIVDFQKSQSHQLVGIVNTGVYIFETEALKYIPNQKVAMLETDVFPKITKLGTLIAFPFQGIWFDITSDKNYQQGLKSMKK